MNRGVLGGLIVLLFLISLVTAVEVDSEVVKKVKEEGKVKVIVELVDEPIDKSVSEEKDPKKEMIKEVQEEVLDKLIVKKDVDGIKKISKKGSLSVATKSEEYDLELVRQYDTVNGFSGEVTEEGLEKLKKDPSVKKVHADKVFHTTLTTSIPQINTNDVWNFSISGFNITGNSETVCVIDTGIDTDHAAFKDKIKAEYCYCSVSDGGSGGCCPDNTNEDLSAEDDNGHGTHVSGTAMGNLSSHPGVAKDSGVVAIKVCDSAGDCNGGDINSAIDWCTNNATKFNISVISISIGDSSQNNDYCNGGAIAPYVNAAVGKNITVVISAGNVGHTAGIANPSCIQNATPVGAVNSNDVIAYNRGNILSLLGPGNPITAPYNDGGTKSLTGTSMSAPHVAGVIALLNQYWRLAYNRIPTVDQIERKLAITGKEIDDTGSSGNYYYRVDVLKALQPFVNYTLTNVANNTKTRGNSSFINISSDVNLTNAKVEFNYANGSRMNYSLTSFNATSFNLNVTHITDGVHTYYVYGDDTVLLGINKVRTITMDSTIPAVTLVSPTNDTTLGKTQQFNFTVSDLEIDTVRFSFENATGTGFNVTPTNESGTWYFTITSSTLEGGLQKMTVFANDSLGQTNQTQSIQFTVDKSSPAVNFSTSSANYSSGAGNVTFNATVLEANIDTVYFQFNNGSGTDFNVTAVNNSGYWTAQYNVAGLAEGSHSVSVYSNDTLGNVNTSESITIIYDTSPPIATWSFPSTTRTYNFTSQNETFNVTVSDALLSIQNVVFYFSNGSSGFNVTANNQSGTWTAQYNISSLVDGTHTIKVFANDTEGNMNNSETISLTANIDSPITTLNSPADSNLSASTITMFNCSAQDNVGLSNVTLYGNWSGWHANETKSLSGTSGEQTFSKTLSHGDYLWNCLVGDSDFNTSFASANRTVRIDTTVPIISAVSGGSPESSSTTVSWTTDESSNTTVYYGTGLSLGSVSSSTSLETSHSRSISSLSASTQYFFNVTSCDSLGNCQTNGTFNFSTTAASSGGGSSGGSSGGGSSGGGSGGSSGGGSSSASTLSTTKAKESKKEAVKEKSSKPKEAKAADVKEEKKSDNKFSKPLTLKKDELQSILLGDGHIVSEVKISIKTEKETTLSVTHFTEKQLKFLRLLEILLI